MVPRFVRSLLGRVTAPAYRLPDETFRQAQRRRSLRRQARRIGRQRP